VTFGSKWFGLKLVILVSKDVCPSIVWVVREGVLVFGVEDAHSAFGGRFNQLLEMEEAAGLEF